jgi:putative PIN family toxin of toxin-antitoxin system
MFKVVMDTNIIIAGLYSRSGASFRIVDAAIHNKVKYALSPLVALEYIGKIEERVKDGLLNLPLEHYLKIIQTLIQNAHQIFRPVLNRPALPDNSDDKILECAIAGSCDVILTFNKKHFPDEILSQHGLSAMYPGEYIKKVRLL